MLLQQAHDLWNAAVSLQGSDAVLNVSVPSVAMLCNGPRGILGPCLPQGSRLQQDLAGTDPDVLAEVACIQTQ